MQTQVNQWDYLIITASNDAQAQAYESQLKLRQDFGLLSDVREAIVIADPAGVRIGSGGSTLYCLMEVLSRSLGDGLKDAGRDGWETVLKNLRILIIHAGGDSKRLPAYGPCGKIFVPVPGESDSAICLSLFDRQLPIFLALPEPPAGAGQVVFTSGDVLLRFEPSDVRFAADGVTGLSCYAEPQQASRHGVFCRGQADEVRLYLQKPSPDEQQKTGAIDAYGQACLDIGVMSFGAKTAVKMLEIFGAGPGQDNRLALTGRIGESVHKWGLDFYREICCAMGRQARRELYLKSVKGSGSKWSEALLNKLFDALSTMPFKMQLLKQCDFLDFGSSRAIIHSGTRLLQEDRGVSHLSTFLDVNNSINDDGVIRGSACWVEGCRINSSLNLGGENVLAGADIDEPISLPRNACLDVIKGRNNQGEPIWFIRCYNVNDTFKETAEDGGRFCGIELLEWLKLAGARPEDAWDAGASHEVWNARIFPAVKNHSEYRHWLWMLDVTNASGQQLAGWRAADRYSLEQILALADHNEFYERRSKIRAQIIQRSLQKMLRPDSKFSSTELAYLLKNTDDLSGWISQIIKAAYRHFADSIHGGTRALVFPRIIHTLGSALSELYKNNDVPPSKALPNLEKLLTPAERDWLASSDLALKDQISIVRWSKHAQNIAFESLEKVIIASGSKQETCPRSTLRSDEIVWARAPARLDVGGGWTDTPPYCLEYGGCVVNAAVDLNGQPPIQAYIRVTDKPVIRIGSIDLGTRIEITDFDGLLDYREATSSFALAKAALVLCGLSPEIFNSDNLEEVLSRFGGGIELTTLAAIPKGSGLGTSSIMGAVIIAAIQAVLGKQPSQRQLFHSVLRLEQALTTGGGWQDQIGGVVDGVKMINTEPGLVPDASIHYVLSDVLDPQANGGQSLLYYTGITRLAKNILQQVVGRYLNRDRAAMATLRRIHLVAKEVADALASKDIARFGRLLDTAWQLNKQLDPASSNEEIESLFERVGPFIYGGKLLGAGGGGFMLMICKSPADALSVRKMLEDEPPNKRARFFDFDISNKGLTVTVC
jgi:fucokinase